MSTPIPLQKQPRSSLLHTIRNIPHPKRVPPDNMCIRFQQNERARLKIKAFYIRLSTSTACEALPALLTLHYLPRINGDMLVIDNSEIKPNLPAFVALHRYVSAMEGAIFGCREKVTAGEGVKFEVYLREEKVLKGVFRKDEGTDDWKMECQCVLENEILGMEKVMTMEIYVAVEGQVGMMGQKVEIEVKRKKRKGRCFLGLEEIPEVRELEGCELETAGVCCCDCTGEESGMRSGGGEFGKSEGMEVEMEGARWVVDFGIWVVCLGVGYLVLKASSKNQLSNRRRL